MYFVASCCCAVSGTTAIVNGREVELIHKQVCKGTCTNEECNHRSHSKRKAKKLKSSLTSHERQAILAGFKPQPNQDFKQEWEQQLKAEGIDRYEHIYT